MSSIWMDVFIWMGLKRKPRRLIFLSEVESDWNKAAYYKQTRSDMSRREIEDSGQIWCNFLKSLHFDIQKLNLAGGVYVQTPGACNHSPCLTGTSLPQKVLPHFFFLKTCLRLGEAVKLQVQSIVSFLCKIYFWSHQGLFLFVYQCLPSLQHIWTEHDGFIHFKIMCFSAL